jgi:RNA polymerase sigma factor (TIGR02999 family)
LLRRERAGHTLTPTALVHEAYIRLATLFASPARRTIIRATAARTLRRILIDHARARCAAKRGGDRVRFGLDSRLDAPAPGDPNAAALLMLDDAVARLAALNERHARIVEMRFFGGMSVEHIALALGVSVSTVESEWRTARAWLHRELGEGGPA